jgi:hypothetical protein
MKATPRDRDDARAMTIHASNNANEAIGDAQRRATQIRDAALATFQASARTERDRQRYSAELDRAQALVDEVVERATAEKHAEWDRIRRSL